MNLYKARINSVRSLSPTAKLYSLQRLTGDFSFLPGQYTSFKVADSGEGLAVRTYSICSLPEELPTFNFCVREIPGGVGTSFLRNNVGREIELTEPAGDFIIKNTGESILFIAAGIGIAPVRPMLKDYLWRNPEAGVELIYVLKEGEYLFREEWEGLREKHENFKITPSLALPTRGREFPVPIPPPRVGEVRWGAIFLVGSPGFVAQTLQLLENLGYNRQSIKTDIWE